MSAFIHNKSFKKGKKKDKRSTTVLIDSAKGRLSERTYFKLLVPCEVLKLKRLDSPILGKIFDSLFASVKLQIK